MENDKTAQNVIRPTKKQRQLLEFIETFIVEHGYGPSYREIMVGCSYTSVATVAVHINNLIMRGHLRKKDRSARSLEIVNPINPTKPKLQTNAVAPAEEKWLVEKFDYFFKQIEQSPIVSQKQIEDMQILIDSLKILGLESASSIFVQRLAKIKERIIE
jgi:SOS-response transcriptional repressor LexA